MCSAFEIFNYNGNNLVVVQADEYLLALCHNDVLRVKAPVFEILDAYIRLMVNITLYTSSYPVGARQYRKRYIKRLFSFVSN